MALKGHKGKRIRKRSKKKKHIPIMEELSETPPPSVPSTPEIPDLPPLPAQIDYDFLESIRDTIALAEAKLEILKLKTEIYHEAMTELEKKEEELKDREQAVEVREAIVSRREIKTCPLLVRSSGVDWAPKLKSKIFPDSEIYISAPKPSEKWTSPSPSGFPTSLDKNIFWKNSLGY